MVKLMWSISSAYGQYAWSWHVMLLSLGSRRQLMFPTVWELKWKINEWDTPMNTEHELYEPIFVIEALFQFWRHSSTLSTPHLDNYIENSVTRLNAKLWPECKNMRWVCMALVDKQLAVLFEQIQLFQLSFHPRSRSTEKSHCSCLLNSGYNLANKGKKKQC